MSTNERSGHRTRGTLSPRTRALSILFDNLAEFAESPAGVAKLRELILALAVHGKLVEQTGDEPATLVKRVTKAEDDIRGSW